MPLDFAGDTLATARELNLTSSSQTIGDSVGSLDSRDYYSFTLSDSLGDNFASRSRFNLSLNGLSANADLELLNSNGEVLQTSAEPGINAESISTILDSGVYYIGVYPAANAFTDYNLSLSATPERSTSSIPSQDPVTAFGDSSFETGVFTVGRTGEVSFDYLFDGGKYRGELAIFNLEGMDASQLGSQAFIQEAVQRALSNSNLGHVVISDSPEAARFSGTITGERQDWNMGKSLGVKTFTMNPGDRFGLMLVPNGTVQEVLNSSSIRGALRPLFSMATADPNDAFDGRQFADANGRGNTFVIEDQALQGSTGSDYLRDSAKGDRDYNDIVFRITGAAGQAVNLDDVINPAHDWRTTQVGGKLMGFINPPANQPLIGIIDTGLVAENPDIDPFRIRYGPSSYRPDKDGNPLLQSGQGDEHGTAIAGIIAATQNNGIGIDGINDRAPLYVARAIGSGQWAEALTDFVDAAVASGQPNAIANLSFDLTQINPDGSVTLRYEFTPAERKALEYARQHGVLIVVAAGNDGELMSVLGQASQEFDNIITVGAVQQVDVPPSTGFPNSSRYIETHSFERSGYSSYGYGLDIVAEGGTVDRPVLSTTGNGVGTLWGTSVATAKVTGAASLVWAANPGLSYRQAIDILEQTATDLQGRGWDAETGYGLLNMAAAVGLATTTAPQSPNTPPILTPTTWSGEGNVTPIERASADYFSGNGRYYNWVPYTIRRGDTLSTIAQRTMGGDTAPYYDFIADRNNIANPNLIYPGRRIEIPQEVSIGGNIQDVWQQNRTTLGNPIETIQSFSSDRDIRYQRFENGSIVSSPSGTFALSGDIRQTFLNTGGLEGWLGTPTSAQTAQGNGVSRQNFENGYILFNGQTATAYRTGNATPSPRPSDGSLDREAAVDYAEQYNDSRNPRYHDYSREGGNCANFVSQCLVAGGLLSNRADSTGRNPYEYINADGLTDYLLEEDLAERVTSVSELRPGDVISFETPSDDDVRHVTLYMGNGQVASNTNDGIFPWQRFASSGRTAIFLHITDSSSSPNPPGDNSSSSLVPHDGNDPGELLRTVNTAWGRKNITVGAVDTDEKVEAVLAAIRAFENGGRYGSNGGSTPGDSGASTSIGAYQERYPREYIPVGNRVMGTRVTVDQFYQGNPLAQDIAAIGRLKANDILDLIQNSNLRDEQQRLEIARQVVNAWGSWYSDRDRIHSTPEQKSQYRQAHSQAILAALNIA